MKDYDFQNVSTESLLMIASKDGPILWLLTYTGNQWHAAPYSDNNVDELLAYMRPRVEPTGKFLDSAVGDDKGAISENIGYKVLETCGDGVYFSPTPRGRDRMVYPPNQWVEDTTGHGLYVFRSHQDARAWIDRQSKAPAGQGAMLGKLWAIWECRCDGNIQPSDNPDNPEELRVSRLMLIRIVEKWPSKGLSWEE